MLGLRCSTQAFSSWELLLIEVCRLVIAVASIVVEHRYQVRRLSCPPPHHMGSSWARD